MKFKKYSALMLMFAGNIALSVPPTWQDIVMLACENKLDSKTYEAYVRNRIDTRIAYYRDQYKKDQKNTDIPVCVIHNNKLNSYDLVNKVFLTSDPQAETFFDQYCRDKGQWRFRKYFEGVDGSVNHPNKALFINDLSCTLPQGDREQLLYGAKIVRISYLLTAVLEHEITHAFDKANGDQIKKTFQLHSDVRLINKDAHVLFGQLKGGNHQNISINPSTASTQEKNADMCAVQFAPNATLYHEYVNSLPQSTSRYGYLSKQKALKLLTPRLVLEDKNAWQDFVLTILPPMHITEFENMHNQGINFKKSIKNKNIDDSLPPLKYQKHDNWGFDEKDIEKVALEEVTPPFFGL